MSLSSSGKRLSNSCNEERSGINATSGCLATLVVAPAHEMG